MKYPLRALLLLSLLFPLAISCESESTPTEPGGDDPNTPTWPDTVTVLYTNDEHGWMERVEDVGGAAEMMALWESLYDYTPEGDFLVLSGGDMWTGAAISTWYNGQSMVEVMNAMGYDAAALGNHEYDVTPDTLALRATQMDFPILAANVTNAQGNVPSYVHSFALVEEAGHTIGVVGLANRWTYELNFPDNVAGLTFGDYEPALRLAVPDAFDAGAEAVVVIAHISANDLQALAPVAEELGVLMIGGGHSHEPYEGMSNGVALLEANTALNYFAATRLIFHEDSSVTATDPWLVHNDQTGASADIESVIEPWRSKLNTELGEVIGYASSTITRQSHLQTNMILDSWLLQPWQADIAISNTGGFRADIPAGEITKATVVGVLPFQNDIIMLTMTGAEVIEYVNGVGAGLRLGGITMVGGPQFLDGSPILTNVEYKVLTTDYLYASSEGLTYDLTVYDPNPYLTSVNFRDPFINWIESLNTSASDPLEDYGDPTARQ